MHMIMLSLCVYFDLYGFMQQITRVWTRLKLSDDQII